MHFPSSWTPIPTQLWNRSKEQWWNLSFCTNDQASMIHPWPHQWLILWLHWFFWRLYALVQAVAQVSTPYPPLRSYQSPHCPPWLSLIHAKSCLILFLALHGSTFNDKVQDLQDPNLWVVFLLQRIQILFQGTTLRIVFLGTNPTQNQFLLFQCICFPGIILISLGRIYLSFVLHLHLPLFLLLTLGILAAPRTYIWFTPEVQHFFHCRDHCHKSLHILASQLTLCPWLETIHEVEKYVLF